MATEVTEVHREVNNLIIHRFGKKATTIKIFIKKLYARLKGTIYCTFNAPIRELMEPSRFVAKMLYTPDGTSE